LTITDFSCAFRPINGGVSPLNLMRRGLALTISTLHYGIVWLVWLGLFMVRPGLALESFRYRRMDSPIGRARRA
jgi:hypothetical protein